MEAVIVLVFWIVPALITGTVASNKNRSGFGWFLFGLIFGLLALMIACAMSTHKVEKS